MRTLFKDVRLDSATTVTIPNQLGFSEPVPVFQLNGYHRVQISALLGGGRTWGAEAKLSDNPDAPWVSLGSGKGTAVGLVIEPDYCGWTDGNMLPGMFPAAIRLTPSAVNAADYFFVRLSLA